MIRRPSCLVSSVLSIGQVFSLYECIVVTASVFFLHVPVLGFIFQWKEPQLSVFIAPMRTDNTEFQVSLQSYVVDLWGCLVCAHASPAKSGASQNFGVRFICPGFAMWAENWTSWSIFWRGFNQRLAHTTRERQNFGKATTGHNPNRLYCDVICGGQFRHMLIRHMCAPDSCRPAPRVTALQSCGLSTLIVSTSSIDVCHFT